MWKKVFTVFLCVTLMMSASLVAGAQSNQGGMSSSDDPPIVPYFTYINSTTTILGISSGQASSYASIIGYSTVTKVSITMYLEKKGFLGLYWTTVTSWSQSFNSSSGTLSKSYSVTGGTYRVRADYVAYSGTASEAYTGYSSEVKN